MKSSNDLTDISIQNLLTMDLEESVVRKCIDEAKSPLQTLHFDRTSTTEGFDRNDRSTRGFWHTEDGRHRVSSFMIDAPEAIDTNSLFPSRSRNRTSQDRSKSRKRKPIFGDSSLNVSTFWPELVTAIGALFRAGDCSRPEQPFGQTLVPSSFVPTASQPSREGQYRIPKIGERPLSPVSPLDESLRYDNKQLPIHQQEFIAFLLRILPKLCLKASISRRIYASKQELLQTILHKLEHQHKHAVLGSLFGDENIKRVDKRLRSSNVAEFLSRLTSMSQSQPKEAQQKDILRSVERVMSILSDVEEDIRRYLAAEDRVNELRSVYDVMCSLDVRSKTLLGKLESYLHRNNIDCVASDLEPLSYVWREMQHSPYTRQKFVSQLVRNDYNVRPATEADLEAELVRQGFQRNA